MKLPRRLLEKILLPVCGLLVTGLLMTGCATKPGPTFTSEPKIQPASASDSANQPDGAREAAKQPAANPAVTPVEKPVEKPVDSSAASNRAPSLTEQGVRFQVGDTVIVSFSGTSDTLLPHEERIKEDGHITLPLIGAVKALGKSDGDLQTEIHDLYVPKYYVRLTVTVKYSMELSYVVLGDVRSPGPKPYLGKTTLTKAIGAAGGLTEFASKTDLVLTRANGTRLTVNYKKAIKDPKLDPQVFPGDSINVRKSLW